MIPELTAFAFAFAGLLLLLTGGRIEHATITPTDQEGTDDGAEALPAADL